MAAGRGRRSREHPLTPRTVLFLHSSAGRYGADRQLLALAGGLDPERYRAACVLARDGPLVGDLRDAGVPVVVRDLAVLRRELLSPAGAARLARALGRDGRTLPALARAHGAALVHANTSVMLGGHLAGLPQIVHVREIYAGFGPLWPAYRRVLERADALVCVSHATRAPPAPHTARAEVIHDGLATAPARAERDVARALLGLDEDAFVAAVLGRISGWKGQAVLARALALCPPNVLGLVAGDAWPGQEHHERELRAEAAALGVGDRLRLVGFHEDVAIVYGAADVVVVPSTAPDPFPNAALEAAAAGCCVVAAAHGGLPELISDGVTGRLFAPGDHVALARALSELAADPARGARLGAAAGHVVPTRFSTARMLDAVQAVYDRVLA